MLSVPLPIVVALMLAMIMLVNREKLLSLPSGRWFLALLGIYCLVLVLIGVRWSSTSFNVMPMLPVLAVCWCILTWIAFRSLTRGGPAIDSTDWPHLIPLAAVLIVLFATPIWLEVVIVLSNLFYAYLLMRLARSGADALRLVKFGAARNCHRAVWISAAMLLYFAVIEIAIALNFELAGGQHAAMIVTVANVPSLFFLGIVAATAGQAGSLSTDADSDINTALQIGSQVDRVTQEDLAQGNSSQGNSSQSNSSQGNSAEDLAAQQDTGIEPDHAALMHRLSELLIDQTLYADTELNLQRLARKTGVPARQVSRAVNSETGLNVSQWVNEARIKAACEQLQQSDATVQEIMQKVGFATKSNFNREFRRITGTSPSGWRRGNLGLE